MILKSILFLFAFSYLLTAQQQQDLPNWVNPEYRQYMHPSEDWYSGFSVDKMHDGEKLIEALQRVENSARSKLVEQIQISIESNSKLISTSFSKNVNGTQSETLTIDYSQDISTKTNAETVGLEVESHYDSNSQMLYAYAFVERDKLAAYYSNQEDAAIRQAEEELLIVDALADSGQKLAAYKRCLNITSILNKAQKSRLFLSSVNGDEAAYSEKYFSLLQETEKRLRELNQSTRVYIVCEWVCPEYPQYTAISDVLTNNISSMLSKNGCVVVSDPDSADYLLNLKASTTQRSDGSDQYGIISYYADISGDLMNVRSSKSVVNIAFYQNPNLYSAGKNEYQAILKAFNSPNIQKCMSELIIPGLQK